MKDYLRFILKYPAPIFYGFALTALSSFGQTFLVSLFVPHIISSLDISKGLFGSLYSLATIGSATLLFFFGKRVDTQPLFSYTRNSLLLLTGGALLLALSVNPFILFPALLILRFSGQGLMTNISQTVVSRHFQRSRGKALSISSLGFSFGEFILPLLFAACIPLLGWRLALPAVSATCVLALLIAIRRLPLQEWEQPTPSDLFPPEINTGSSKALSSASLRSLLKTREFWAIAPNVLILAMATTGYFFYQMLLVKENKWNPELYALFFSIYAISRFFVSVVIGPLVDRYRSRALYILHWLPIIAGSAVFAIFGTLSAAGILLIGIAITMGSSGVIRSALFAELFDNSRLGAARSLFTSIMVLGTSFGSAGFGFALEHGIGMRGSMALCAVLLTISSITALILLSGKRLKALPQSPKA